MAKQKFKEFDEKIKYLKTLDKNVLIGIMMGVTSGRVAYKDYQMFAKYIKGALRSKR